MIRRLVGWVVAACLAVSVAHASDGVPVQVKLSGYSQPARAGVPFTVDVVVSSKVTIMLQNFTITPSASASGFTHNAPTLPYLLTSRGSRIVRVSFTPTTDAAGIKFSFTAGTERITREFDFSSTSFAKATTPSALLSIPGDVVTAPFSAAAMVPDVGVQPLARELRAGTLKPVRVAVPENATGVQTTVQVKGRFVYYRSDGQAVPVEGATVRIYDEDWDWDENMATVLTDYDGRFNVSCSEDESGPDIYVEIEMANSRVVLEDDYLEYNYLFRTNTKDDFSGSTADFGTFSPNGDLGSAICHIFTNVYRASRYLAGLGWNTPGVDVQYPSSDWPHYDGSEIHIPSSVDGTRYGWQSGTQIHEFGHHVMRSFFYIPDNDYDNGICNNPNGDPGHCVWCQEDDGTAIKEGFSNWLADVVGRTYESTYGLAILNGRSVEGIGECRNSNGNTCACDPYRTEGFFGSMLRDLEDSDNEDDSRGGDGVDQLDLGVNDIMDTMNSANAEGPSGFIQKFIDTHSNLSRTSIWNTLSNAGYELDETPPGVSPYFESTSHNEGISAYPSLDRTIDMTWQAASDDWSGAVGYSLAIGTSATMPQAVAMTNPGQLTKTMTAPGPGTYYITLRAVDAEGRWSNSYALAGPYRIRDPEPADLLFPLVQPSGWEAPIVLRDNPDATSGSAVTSPALDGGGITYWNTSYMNGGELGAAAGMIRFLIDGEQKDSVSTSALGPYATRKYINQGGFVTLGGRHTAEVWLDAQEDQAEDSETNNHYSRQFVFEPQNLVVDVQRNGSSAPVRDAGQQYLGFGTTGYDNCDGFQYSHVYQSGQFSATAIWSAAYTFANYDFMDTDLKLFDNAYGAFSGFATARRTCSRGDGQLDAVFTNKVPNNTTIWNVGVIDADGDAPAYKLRQIISSNVNVGDTITVTLGTDEMMQMFHFGISSGEVGKYSLIVTGAPRFNGGNISTVWLDDDSETASLEAYTARVTSDYQGKSALIVSALDTGIYGIALYRNPSGGRGPVTFKFRIEPAAPEPAPTQPLGWNGPLVPRATADATSTSVQPGTALNGDAGSTWMNLAVRNDGELSAPLVETRIRHASTSVGGPTFLTIAPGATATSRNAFSATIPAGRRVLWVDVDPDGDITETNEDDNRFGRQWVWKPPVASFDTPIWRGFAPRVDAGWSTLPEGDPLFYNQDGIRAPVLSSHGVTQWAGFGVMPRLDDDVDLWVHEVSTSPTEGFDEPLTTSAWGPSELDYVLVDVSSTARRGFDLGIVRATESDLFSLRVSNDTTSYLTQIVGDISHATSVGTFGAYTLAAHRLMDVHTFPLAFGRYTVRLVNTSGSVNWGLAVHEPGKPFQNRTLARKRADWLDGNGVAEEVTLNISNPGNYAIVVFKTGSGDVVKSGSYRLQITATTADAEVEGLPQRTRIVSATPAPFRTDVRFGFELAEAAEVTIEVLDVMGARRRVLTHAAYPAGRQSVAWDGRDAAGGQLPPGMYLVRMLAGGQTSTLKVVRMK